MDKFNNGYYSWALRFHDAIALIYIYIQELLISFYTSAMKIFKIKCNYYFISGYITKKGEFIVGPLLSLAGLEADHKIIHTNK